MKKFLFILLAMLTMCVSFSSCGSDDEDDTPTRVVPTVTEIQGTWGFESQFNYYYSFTFTDNRYLYSIYDTKRNDIDEYAGGTFTISNGKLVLNRTYGSARFAGDDIYWTSSSKNFLHITQLGDFIKVK